MATLTAKKQTVHRFQVRTNSIEGVLHVRIGADKCCFMDGNFNFGYVRCVAAAMIQRRFGTKVDADTIDVVPVEDRPPKQKQPNKSHIGRSSEEGWWHDRY